MALLASFVLATFADEERYVRVTGRAEVIVKPDSAYITVYAQADESRMVTAIKQADDLVADIKAGIKKGTKTRVMLSVVDTAISGTTDPKDNSTVFQAVRRIRLSCNPDPKGVCDVIDEAVKAGALLRAPSSIASAIVFSQVVVYGLEDYKDVLEEVRKLAMEDAVAEAKRAVKRAGIEMGEILTISVAPLISSGVDADFPTDYVGTNPKEIRIQQDITVEYELKSTDE